MEQVNPEDNNQNAPSTQAKYTVRYNANGGSGAPANVSVNAGESFTVSPKKPTKGGLVFTGWSDSK